MTFPIWVTIAADSFFLLLPPFWLACRERRAPDSPACLSCGIITRPVLPSVLPSFLCGPGALPLSLPDCAILFILLLFCVHGSAFYRLHPLKFSPPHPFPLCVCVAAYHHHRLLFFFLFFFSLRALTGGCKTTTTNADHVKAPLENYMAQYPKVKIVRLPKREGLIRARLLGLEHATAPVVTYLDSHCECTEGQSRFLFLLLIVVVVSFGRRRHHQKSHDIQSTRLGSLPSVFFFLLFLLFSVLSGRRAEGDVISKAFSFLWLRQFRLPPSQKRTCSASISRRHLAREPSLDANTSYPCPTPPTNMIEKYRRKLLLLRRKIPPCSCGIRLFLSIRRGL